MDQVGPGRLCLLALLRDNHYLPQPRVFFYIESTAHVGMVSTNTPESGNHVQKYPKFPTCNYIWTLCGRRLGQILLCTCPACSLLYMFLFLAMPLREREERGGGREE